MNIVIVDDDCLVAASLKIILEAEPEFHIIGTGENGLDAVRLYDSLLPDLLLMDIRMKDMNGLEASETILSRHPEAKILLLTTFSDDEYIMKALKTGTKGYLLKQDYPSIIPAIKAVSMGQTVFGNEIMAKIPDLLHSPRHFSYENYQISPRDYEIIKLVSDGLSNKEIAEQLFLSEGTVRNYLSVILEKLNLRDRTQLAVFYYQHL